MRYLEDAGNVRVLAPKGLDHRLRQVPRPHPLAVEVGSRLPDDLCSRVRRAKGDQWEGQNDTDPRPLAAATLNRCAPLLLSPRSSLLVQVNSQTPRAGLAHRHGVRHPQCITRRKLYRWRASRRRQPGLPLSCPSTRETCAVGYPCCRSCRSLRRDPGGPLLSPLHSAFGALPPTASCAKGGRPTRRRETRRRHEVAEAT